MAETREPTGKRRQQAEERRSAVLEAAIVEFIANGFVATRIEDVAARAGVAKGTVYLYFPDKEALFAEAIRTEMLPIVGQVRQFLEDAGLPPRTAIERGLGVLLDRIASGRTGDVMRLIMAESLRFPALTSFYREEVVMPVFQKMAALLQRAKQAGALRSPEMAQFPHLVVAPMLLAVIAQRMAPKIIEDPKALLKAHLDCLFTK